MGTFVIFFIAIFFQVSYQLNNGLGLTPQMGMSFNEKRMT